MYPADKEFTLILFLDRSNDKDLEKETQTIMMKYNRERIADLKRKIAEGEQVMMERAQKLNG